MKHLLVWLGLGGFAGATGLSPLPGHVDLRWTWQVGEGWELEAVASGGDGSVSEPAEIYLPLSDKPWAATGDSGARIIQPNNATQNFTGVAVGEPSWYAVVSLPGTGEAWPGFESLQGSTVFGEYLESDPRLPQPQNTARPWIKVAMGEVFHDGPGTPRFSMWTGTGNDPRVWMSTNNGQANNFYLLSGGSHAHMNWAFGDLGIYRVGLSASAFLGPEATNPTGESEEFVLTFTVGPVARWKASNFQGEELENPSLSGMMADANGDGLVNLIDYGFGLDPRGGDRSPVAPGLGLPEFSLRAEDGKVFQVLSYPRRKAGVLTKPLVYTAQFSPTLEEEDWMPQGGEVVTDLNADWERVEVVRELSAGTPRGFGRVRLEFAD